MKKSRIISVFLTLALLLALIQVPGAAAEEPMVDTSVRSGCKTLDAQAPLYGSDKYLDTAKAAILYEVNSGTMVYFWNPDDRLPPASLIKIVTCMVVLENCSLDETVIVSATAMSELSSGAATLKLEAGEKFTVEQLLFGLMVGSANDAAVVLAEHVSGSHGAFVALMNQYVQNLGCKDTFITNSHGLHDENQYTTARDMARIVAEAMKNEDFMRFFGAQIYTLPGKLPDEGRKVETTNYLIMPGATQFYNKLVTGGRTGITNDSKKSLVVTATNGDRDYIAIVLSATTVYNEDSGTVKTHGHYEEIKTLLSMGLYDHQIRQVLYKDQVLTQYHVDGGRNSVALGVAEPSLVMLPDHIQQEDLSVRFGVSGGSLVAPIEKGEQITTVEVWVDNVCVAFAPVIALNSAAADDGTMLQKNQFGGSSKVWVVILIVLVVGAVIAVLAYLVYRTTKGLREAKTRRRHRRRRSDRRRTR